MPEPIPVAPGHLPTSRPDEATMKDFTRGFRRLCERLNVSAAFYVPVLTEDRAAVRGAITGGETSATKLLDVLVAVGASAIRAGAPVPPSTRPS